MTARICPKCGCVYHDARAECTDCNVFTRPASDDNIYEYESKTADSLDALSDRSERTEEFWHPTGGFSWKGTALEIVLRLIFH